MYIMEHELYQEHEQILQDVLNERNRQNIKFGSNRNHHPFLWNTILSEEVGEAAEASLDIEFKGASIDNYRKELVEIAAVAIAAIQDLDTHGRYVIAKKKCEDCTDLNMCQWCINDIEVVTLENHDSRAKI